MLSLCLPAALTAGLLAATGAGAAEPLLRLSLNGHARNTGRLGGEAALVEYAPGEGPAHAPGVAGAGISFARSSRSGGSGQEKAGGALTFRDERLAGLRRFTLTAWFLPLATTGPARLFWLDPEWEVFLSGTQATLKVKSGGEDHSFGTPREGPAIAPGWNFLAVTADLNAGTASLYLGGPDRPPVPAARWEGIPPPDRGAGEVEIGNLGGIRPFKGLMDDVRLYDVALTESEVRAVHSEIRPQAATLQESIVPREGRGDPDFRYSDVCFSTRSVRRESMDAIRAFQATRVVWVYTSDAEFARSVHAAGATLQGAINTIHRTPDLSAYCVDLDGTKLVAPWMVAFDRKDPVKWGCNNQPAYRQAVLDAAKKALDAGVDWLQFDDWSFIVSAHSWGGGCLCDRCTAAFRDYLAALPRERVEAAGIEGLDAFDYRKFLAEKHGIRAAAAYKAKRSALPTTPLFEDFQRRSVRAYFQDLRAELDRHAGRRVPLSVNGNLTNPSQHHNFLADIVDFYLGETWSPRLADLSICARAALALGKHQIVSPLPHSVPEARVAMAATYALGEFYLVPWDLYMGSDATGIKPRYFGTVAEYGDLYHFVREHAALFDGHEAVATVGVLLNTDRYDAEKTRAVVNRLLRAQVPFAFVPAGRRFFEQRLDAARLGRFQLLLRLNELEDFAPEDRQALEAAQEKVGVFAADAVDDATLAGLAPVDVWGPEGITVLPRVPAGGGRRELVLHVLNRVQAAPDQPVAPLRWLSLGLRPAAMLGAKVARATWYAPGQAPRPMDVDVLPSGARLIIPEVAEWGVARVEFAD